MSKPRVIYHEDTEWIKKSEADKLAKALTSGGYNSIRERLALMAEGEGTDHTVYMEMANAALIDLDKALKKYWGKE